MTLIQKISTFLKKRNNFFLKLDLKALRIQKFNPLFLASFLVIFSSLFFVSSNFINKKNDENYDNLG